MTDKITQNKGMKKSTKTIMALSSLAYSIVGIIALVNKNFFGLDNETRLVIGGALVLFGTAGAIVIKANFNHRISIPTIIITAVAFATWYLFIEHLSLYYAIPLALFCLIPLFQDLINKRHPND